MHGVGQCRAGQRSRINSSTLAWSQDYPIITGQGSARRRRWLRPIALPPAWEEERVCVNALPPAGWVLRMHDSHPSLSYRSLELLCRKQAALSSTKATRMALEEMAAEYRRLAEWLERQQSGPD
jgi:hypothetical protein